MPARAQPPLRGLLELDPVPGDKSEACAALLRLLANGARGWSAVWLASQVAELEPTTKEKLEVRGALLRIIAADAATARDLIQQLALLDPTAEDKRQARVAPLRLLATETGAEPARRLVTQLELLTGGCGSGRGS